MLMNLFKMFRCKFILFDWEGEEYCEGIMLKLFFICYVMKKEVWLKIEIDCKFDFLFVILKKNI